MSFFKPQNRILKSALRLSLFGFFYGLLFKPPLHPTLTQAISLVLRSDRWLRESNTQVLAATLFNTFFAGLFGAALGWIDEMVARNPVRSMKAAVWIVLAASEGWVVYLGANLAFNLAARMIVGQSVTVGWQEWRAEVTNVVIGIGAAGLILYGLITFYYQTRSNQKKNQGEPQ